MWLVPDPPRAGPGRRGWTSTGLHRQRVPETWQLQGGAGVAGTCSDASGPGSLSPFSGLPLPLPITCRQRKPPTSPTAPSARWEKWVWFLDFCIVD